MGQEAFDIEGCVQKENKRKGVMNMLRKTKRTLSLVLTLIMICSTLGVMAFAAVSTELYWCEVCRDEVYAYYTPESQVEWGLDCIVECPYHLDHDAELYKAGTNCYCVQCGEKVYQYDYVKYVCLD